MISLIFLFTALSLVFGSANYSHTKEHKLQKFMFSQYELFNSKTNVDLYNVVNLKQRKYRFQIKVLFYISSIILMILLVLYQLNFLVGDI
jgi:hypothetical protein